MEAVASVQEQRTMCEPRNASYQPDLRAPRTVNVISYLHPIRIFIHTFLYRMTSFTASTPSVSFIEGVGYNMVMSLCAERRIGSVWIEEEQDIPTPVRACSFGFSLGMS